jgi:hypothetical protein
VEEASHVMPASKSDGTGKKKSYTKKQLAVLVTKSVKLGKDKSSDEIKKPRMIPKSTSCP